MKKPVLRDQFLNELRLRKNGERAKADKAYHKSSREHWGIPVPECDRLARSLSKGLTEPDLIALAKSLWETDLFDAMVCGIKVLGQPKVKASPELWNCILECLEVVDGWGLEDGLAHPAWRCLLADEALLDQLEEWTRDPNFWMRRAALVYTLPFAKSGRNPERMLRWASSYASDPEWFIQKAIGWWLRVLGGHNPARVIQFLESHWKRLKGVARKEATRKLAPEWQVKIAIPNSKPATVLLR